MKTSISTYLAAAAVAGLAGGATWSMCNYGLGAVLSFETLRHLSVSDLGPMAGLLAVSALLAAVVYAVGAVALGPIAFWLMRRAGQTGPMPAAMGGSVLSALPVAIAAGIEGVGDSGHIWAIVASIAVGGAFAGWTYRRALIAMGAMPRPARPS